ncbi:DUF3823 domain-containing protein [Galbibacter pacificus]|uniref:DUF3823 domain-containing protein n=1 Tax=Galbibacter pacificus TaxID=2996052 RepID=A0ABT6FMT6_9FLAO|nr:DUF3823 domain-containing protein [Galbibacter pacificus]MDG3581052.1 DUF3823 domain-containing protein [Galbibacter pacificus]MDG3584530.1 DUF3823 domain-containing protein [Galbibacter pacificus]
MKRNIKIKSWILLVISLCLFACSEVDNYNGPDSSFEGRIIDETTGEIFVTETGGIQIQLEELSWSETPSPQHIPIKEDGTFEDSQLFSGHYLVMPINGPFWPLNQGIELDINGSTSHDFEVLPYLKIENLEYSLEGNTLVLNFNLKAPISEGLPNVLDIKPFVNITNYVGNGATISQYSDPNKIDINAAWDSEMASTTYELRVSDLKAGRKFYARVGARVDDSFKKYNYSQIVEVDVPSE